MAGVDILASAMNGANAAYLADTYARWVENPAGVDPSFAELFAALNDDAKAVLTDAMGASWAPAPPRRLRPARGSEAGAEGRQAGPRAADPDAIRKAALDSVAR
jgi:2-oxoglutarate dehydrogenase E1 component